MKTILSCILLIMLIGCASTPQFDFHTITYQKIKKEVLGYGFSKSMNESMARNMAETTARKNVAEQLAGMQFVLTDMNGEQELKLSIRNVEISGMSLDKTAKIEKTGVLIVIVKAEAEVEKPMGEGVLLAEMRTQFSDDLLKISKSRTNVIQDLINTKFPKAHEVKGTVFIDETDVGWNIDTGVIQYYESYLIVIESVI